MIKGIDASQHEAAIKLYTMHCIFTFKLFVCCCCFFLATKHHTVIAVENISYISTRPKIKEYPNNIKAPSLSNEIGTVLVL